MTSKDNLSREEVSLDTESEQEEFPDATEMQYNNPVYSNDREHVFKDHLHFDFALLPRVLKLKYQSRRRKILCASVVIFVILVFATCLALLVTLSSSKKEDHHTTNSETVTNGHTTKLNGVLYIVNYNYTKDYTDSSSEKYKELEAVIRNQITEVVDNSDVAEDYTRTTITRFRSGSIISDIVLHFKSDHSSHHLVEVINKAFVKSLIPNSELKTFLGKLQIDHNKSYFIAGDVPIPTDHPVNVDTTPAPVLPTTEAATVAKCEPIQSRTCLTGDVTYSFTGFPNFFGHTNQNEAEVVLANIRFFLMNSGCYAHAQRFVCSVLMPDCEEKQIRPPCKEMCHDFYRKCGSMLPRGFQTMDCGSLPSQETGTCIQAPPIPDLNVRMRSDDVSAPHRGAVEVEIFPNHWNTVCGHDWSGPDGDVFCKQMNYSYAMKTWTEQTLSLDTFIYGVNCLGSESNVAQCEILAAGDIPMACGEVAMVECGLHNEESTDLAVRLSGGNASEGRVEVYGGGRWGTVCDDDFGKNEANVVCRMLGFSNGNTVTVEHGKNYGDLHQHIILDEVTCQGSEVNLGDCQHSGIDIHDCQDWEAVGVRCDNTVPLEGSTVPTGSPELEVRLVEGPDNSTGVLSVKTSHEETWGTVCKDLFSNNTATVFCRMMGFRTGIYEDQKYGPGTGPIKMNYVYCRGTEQNISECFYETKETHHCSHFDDVSISCE